MKHLSLIESIMSDFAFRTGLSVHGRTPDRYLWTDAYAVCNYLELFRVTGDADHKRLALNLVGQVHRTLGRFSVSDARQGWISGLEDEKGEAHPTLGGLRIGKPMKERGRSEPYHERLEWDRDGQYFHYLTKWMRALDAVGWVTGDGSFCRWAVELAQAAYAGFTRVSSAAGRPRMAWKMSIDLSYPLVESMGQHDPLDGLITFLQVQSGAQRSVDPPDALRLDQEIAGMRAMCRDTHWASGDPLGIGGLLADACLLTQLISIGYEDDTDLLKKLIDDALISLNHYVHHNALAAPAEYRLAFRELGLSIGLQGIKKMLACIGQYPERFVNHDELSAGLTGLLQFVPLHEAIDEYWIKPANQAAKTWSEHVNINSIMLATSLGADGVLVLPHHQLESRMKT